MSVCYGENSDQQSEQIRMVVPRALVGQKYVPVRDRVYGATNPVVETGEHAEYSYSTARVTE